MTRSRRGLIGAILTTGVATAISFGINFCITPLITNKLGADAYGFITLANTLTSYAAILTTGLNSYATRFIAVEYHSGNLKQASKYYSTLFFANVALSIAVFLIALVMDFNITGFIDVPNRLMTDVQYLILYVFANFAIVTVSSSFSSSAYLEQKLDVFGVVQSLSYIAEAVVLLVLYCALPAKIFYYGLGLLAASAVILAGNFRIYKRFTPAIDIRPSLFSLDSLRTLVVNGLWNSLNSLGNTLNTGLDLIIGNIFLGPLAMGQLAISRTFQSLFSRLFQLVSQAFQPRFLQFYSGHNLEELKEEFAVSMKLSGFISAILFAGFFVFCQDFYQLWIPDQNNQTLYALTMLTITCSLFEGPVYPLYYIYTLTVKNKIPCLITIVGGCLNVLGMLILLSFSQLGVYAIALTTAIVMGFINLVTNPFYMSRCLGVNPLLFYKPLLRILAATAGLCLLFSYIRSFAVPSSWQIFLLICIVCLIVALPLYLVMVMGPKAVKASLSNLASRR